MSTEPLPQRKPRRVAPAPKGEVLATTEPTSNGWFVRITRYFPWADDRERILFELLQNDHLGCRAVREIELTEKAARRLGAALVSALGEEPPPDA